MSREKRPPSINRLIITALQRSTERHTDADGRLDESRQRRVVVRWLLRFYPNFAREFAQLFASRAVANCQHALAHRTRPSASAILTATQDAGLTVAAVQPPLFAGFADERYYVAPGVSKLGRDMLFRDALFALRMLSSRVVEYTAKRDRVAAIVKRGYERGLLLDEPILRLLEEGSSG